MKKLVATLVILCLTILYTKAQTQIVRGLILDTDSKMPLPNVSVILLGSEPVIGTVSDVDGRFRLEKVPIGRHSFQFQSLGYKSQTMNNVIVTSGKEVVLELSMVESVETLEEVVVVASEAKELPINEMAKVSARTFSLEEVTRFSGGRNDVARLATNFAGVSSANDSRNDIVVRGNSPTGLLWRVEGLPVATTNHFATFGTTGGPVSALNTNLLKTSDFLTGAFPAEYGNANAAVFDVKFRNGNTEKYEFTAQMSAFSGLELMAEGPFNKKKNGSFLISYRYGIASLAATGTSATPYYQDLSFKLDFGSGKFGRFELFGFGGLSSIDFIGDEIQEDDLFADPFSDSYFKSNIGAVGMNHTIRFSNKAFLKTTIGATATQSQFLQDNFLVDSITSIKTGKYRATEVNDLEARYTLSSQYNKKYSARFNLRAGVIAELFNIQSLLLDRDRRADIPDLDDNGIPDYFVKVRDIDTYSLLSQFYAQGEYRFTDELSLTAGLHAQHNEYNDDFLIAPRSALAWQFTKKQRLSVAYGLHGQLVPLPILTYLEPTADGSGETTNKNLSFMKSHHFVVGYDYSFAPSWRFKSEVYYQSLFDLPIDQLGTSYSVLNQGSNFTFDEQGSLVSQGTGYNYGLEVTLEKFLSKNFYMLTTASIFNSRYEGSDEVERNTAFNTGYVLNVLGGREFPISKRATLTFDTKFTTSGGRPFTPIDVAATRANDGREVLIDELAFSERLDSYFRWDVKFGFRLNSKSGKISHQFFVDLQNVTNRENMFTKRYNPVTDRVDPVYQIGFFPDVMYRIQF